MNLTKTEFSDYIKQFNFRELFNDMGWNNDETTQPISVINRIPAKMSQCNLRAHLKTALGLDQKLLIIISK